MGTFCINHNRCVSHYKNMQCHTCQQNCPQQAIANRHIDLSKCNECGLCLAVCPVHAIETTVSYQQELVAVCAKETVVLNCQMRDKRSGFPCLGFLDTRILWAIAQEQRVVLNLHHCKDCNLAVSQQLHHIVRECNNVLRQEGKSLVSGGSDNECNTVPEQTAKISRRDFFKQFMKAAVITAEAIVSSNEDVVVAYCPEGYIKQQLDKMDTTQNNTLFYTLTIGQDCNACGLCAKICPQQALQAKLHHNHYVLKYDAALCYNCGVCQQNCPRKAIHIAKADGDRIPEHTIPLPLCEQCKQPFQPIGENTICLDCYQHRDQIFWA